VDISFLLKKKQFTRSQAILFLDARIRKHWEQPPRAEAETSKVENEIKQLGR